MHLSELHKLIAAAMKANQLKARGYADYFQSPLNKSIGERHVFLTLKESIELSGGSFYTNEISRPQGHDPPDLEALDPDGRRVAIEITELTDQHAIEAYKQGLSREAAEWDQEKFKAILSEIIASKDTPNLKGGRYLGGFVLIIHTDEQSLLQELVSGYLDSITLVRPTYLSSVYLLLSYDPRSDTHPFFRLYREG